MEDEKISNKFKFSIAKLCGWGDSCLTLYEKDFSILEAYGINAAFKLNVETKLQELRNFPSDNELFGASIDLCEVKDKTAEELRVAIRTIMSRVENVFKKGSGQWKRFGTKGLSQMNDNLLSRCGFRVGRMCNIYLAKLASKGVTPALLNELQILSTTFYNNIDEFQDAELERVCVTTERRKLANDLYDLIVEMFDYGKDYWSTRNDAKYKAYIIYNTPSGRSSKKDKNPADPLKPE